MPSFKATIEIEVEITYIVDKEIRQGEDARYPSEPQVDDVFWVFVDQEAIQSDVEDMAIIDFEERRK